MLPGLVGPAADIYHWPSSTTTSVARDLGSPAGEPKESAHVPLHPSPRRHHHRRRRRRDRHSRERGPAGGSGVDGAVHRAAGPALLEECRTVGGCPTGEARITGAGRLAARYVIHAVGPVWHGGDRREPQLLAACHRHALELAAANGCRTVAFPRSPPACTATRSIVPPRSRSPQPAQPWLTCRRSSRCGSGCSTSGLATPSPRRSPADRTARVDQLSADRGPRADDRGRYGRSKPRPRPGPRAGRGTSARPRGARRTAPPPRPGRRSAS